MNIFLYKTHLVLNSKLVTCHLFKFAVYSGLLFSEKKLFFLFFFFKAVYFAFTP